MYSPVNKYYNTFVIVSLLKCLIDRINGKKTMKNFSADNFNFDDLGIEFTSSETVKEVVIDETPARVESMEAKIDEIRDMLDVDDLVNSRTNDAIEALEELASIILPLLYNLSKGDGQDTIVWPSSTRIPIIEKKISEIKYILEKFN
jgi:hypothetical protein